MRTDSIDFAPRPGRLRVALVTETYPPEINGVAMTLGRMVEGLSRRGHHVQVVRPRQEGDAWAPRTNGVEHALVRGLPIPRYERLKLGLPAGGLLKRMWSEGRPDVVHIATEGPLGWSALGAARSLGISVSTDFHTNFHSYSKHYGLGWLERGVAAYLRSFHNRARCTLVPTEGMRRKLAEQGFQGLRVVARGVDTVLFHPSRRSQTLRSQWGAAQDDPVVLYVGRLAPEKNLSLVIKAFEAMRAEQPRARLVLVGDGPYRAGLEAGNHGYVFAGMRVGEDLAAHYASGDIFLFPSVTETYGNVTMEAMASGLAVVAYDYAAAEEHIRSGLNGLTAPFDDGEAFLRQALTPVRDPDYARDLGRSARRRAENIDWEQVFEALERALRDAMEAQGEHAAA
ncbi:MAG TPA: glycosyltransferase family 1 protein [Burkholderiales bacterium]|nr:glycosyltransferase family 1 protein [Burkholderiales bacterium]